MFVKGAYTRKKYLPFTMLGRTDTCHELLRLAHRHGVVELFQRVRQLGPTFWALCFFFFGVGKSVTMVLRLSISSTTSTTQTIRVLVLSIKLCIGMAARVGCVNAFVSWVMSMRPVISKFRTHYVRHCR